MVLGDDEASSSNTMATGTGAALPGLAFSALIVDDNPFLRDLHSFIVKSVGFTPQVAQNGQEAVDIIRSGAKFDIILMDLEMPVMNGIEATKAIRDMGVTCKIAGVTSCEVPAQKEAFIAAGLNFFHEKPLTVGKIMSCLDP